MGSIVGSIIGGIGDIIGGNQAAQGEQQAAQTALTGYKYLDSNPLISQAQSGGSTALTGEQGVTGDIQNLLTNGQSSPAYQNYLNSTGYNFQMQQGTSAIDQNAASKGLLDSGATGKALTSYGQGLASTSFQNYLGDLGGLSGLYTTQANQGLGAATAVGQAGTQGGATAANMQGQAAQSIGTSTANAFNLLGGSVGSSTGSTGASNFFSSPAQSPFAGM